MTFYHFIEKMSEIVRRLTKLTHKNQRQQWTDQQENAFIHLKNRLTQALILEHDQLH